MPEYRCSDMSILRGLLYAVLFVCLGLDCLADQTASLPARESLSENQTEQSKIAVPESETVAKTAAVVTPPTQLSAAKSVVVPIQPSHVTIYSDRSALVREDFDISLKEGINRVVFKSIPGSIMTGSFFLKFSPDDKDIHVLERSYDLNSKTLQFLVQSPDQLKRRCELYYLVRDLRWRIFYVAALSTSLRSIDLNGWIQLDNESGKNFAKVRVDLVSSPGVKDKASPKEVMDKPSFVASQGSGYPYHLYEPIELKNGSNKHISWAQAQGIKLKQDLRIQISLEHLQKWEDDMRIIPVQTWVSFANTSRSHGNVSRAMPPGFMTVYQQKAKGGAHIVGTSKIDHTPAHGIIEFRVPSETTFHMGTSDEENTAIEAELQQTSYRKLSKNIYEVSYKLTVRNPTDRELSVNVFAATPMEDKWELQRESLQHSNIRNHNIVWKLELPPKKTQDLQYRIRIYNIPSL